MPRITLTEAARRVEAERQRRERVQRIITTAAKSRGLDMKSLSVRTGIEYQALCKRVRGGCSFPLADLTTIADTLGLDDQTRAALAGSKTKCRFEMGYREAAG